jgi:glycosyltransferase involved in cell wall biosynthesis
VSSQVHFLGFRNDIPILARASVAVLLPSQQEGLPCSVMEALSLGTPVIGSRIRGVEDLLASGGGLQVEVGNIDALAAAMRQVIDSPQEAAAMGRKGRAAMADYDVRHIIQLHEQLYASVLAA